MSVMSSSSESADVWMMLDIFQGLTLLHFSAQPNPFKPLMRPPSLPHRNCSRQAEKWTSISPCQLPLLGVEVRLEHQLVDGDDAVELRTHLDVAAQIEIESNS